MLLFKPHRQPAHSHWPWLQMQLCWKLSSWHLFPVCILFFFFCCCPPFLLYLLLIIFYDPILSHLLLHWRSLFIILFLFCFRVTVFIFNEPNYIILPIYIARVLQEYVPVSPLQAFVVLWSFVLPLNPTTYGYCFCFKQPIIFMWDLKNKNHLSTSSRNCYS